MEVLQLLATNFFISAFVATFLFSFHPGAAFFPQHSFGAARASVHIFFARIQAFLFIQCVYVDV